MPIMYEDDHAITRVLADAVARSAERAWGSDGRWLTSKCVRSMKKSNDDWRRPTKEMASVWHIDAMNEDAASIIRNSGMKMSSVWKSTRVVLEPIDDDHALAIAPYVKRCSVMVVRSDGYALPCDDNTVLFICAVAEKEESCVFSNKNLPRRAFVDMVKAIGAMDC